MLELANNLDEYDQSFLPVNRTSHRQSKNLPHQSTPYESDPIDGVRDLRIESSRENYSDDGKGEHFQPLNSYRSYSKSYSEDSATPTPRLEKEISYKSSLSSLPMSHLPSDGELDQLPSRNIGSYRFPPKEDEEAFHRQKFKVDTVSSLSQIKTVPNLPSSASMSLDSPTPSRHPDFSNSKRSNNEHSVFKQGYRVRRPNEVSSSHNQSSLPQNLDVGNDSSVRRKSDTSSRPLPALPTESFQSNGYYNHAHNESLHEIAVDYEDSISDGYNERQNKTESPDIVDEHSIPKVQKTRRRLGSNTKRHTNSTVSKTSKAGYDFQAQLTPIRNYTSDSREFVDDAISSPMLSETSLVQSPVSKAGPEEELRRLRNFLQDIPGGGQLLEKFGAEAEKQHAREPEQSIFETPRNQTSGVDSTDTSREATTRIPSIMKNSSSGFKVHQSTPINPLNNRRVVSKPSPKEPHVVKFASDVTEPSQGQYPSIDLPVQSIHTSVGSTGRDLPKNIRSASSATLQDNTPSPHNISDTGISKLLMLLAEKDARIEKLDLQLESTSKELEAAKKYIHWLRGEGEKISPKTMPDAEWKIAESQKLYYRLEMPTVDKLGNVKLRNLIKNILLKLGVPFSQLQGKLESITNVLQQEQIYMHFANDIHYELYSKNINLAGDAFSAENAACLSDMVTLVRRYIAKLP